MLLNHKLVIACLALMISGCGAAPSNVERFKADQEATQTPHGKINLDSVSESQNGGIKYQTADGNAWEVHVEPAADGSARYGQPVRQTQ